MRIQISHIHNTLFVIWCPIFNYIINKLTPHGIPNSQNSTKVTANISNFKYSAITIGVFDPD